MLEPTTSSFISAKWIKPLWKQLEKIRGQRKKELEAIGNDFGDPLALARYYVQPDCQHHNPADYDEREPISFVRSSVFKTINEFLKGDFLIQGDGRNQMFVLSDAGIGKTSLFLMLKLAHLMSFWPKEHDCFLLKLGKETLETIQTIKNRANTVLLLDALDEDPSAWGRIDQRLQELLSETSTFRRVLISCRTQFFPDEASDPFGSPGRVKVAGFVCPLIYLSLFDDTQVEEYLRKRFPRRWYLFASSNAGDRIQQSQEIVAKMDSLRLRPLLLAHIDYIIEARESVWNDYTIYKALIESWLLREARKGFSHRKSSPSSNDLLRGCITIAGHMHSASERSITQIELKRLMLLDPNLAHLQHIDIGGRSLLNRRSDGAFRFSHYTIQEFLLVHGAVTRKPASDAHDIRVTDQMLRFFLFANCSGVPTDRNAISRWTSQVPEADFRGLDLSDLVLPGGILLRAKLAGAVLDKADLQEVDLRGANLHRASIQSANLSKANLSDADLREANCQASAFVQANLERADLRGGTFRQATFTSASLATAQVNPEDLIGAIGAPSVTGKRMMLSFSPEAQMALALARKEAFRFKNNVVGTDFLLLGILRLKSSPALTLLEASGIDRDSLRRELSKEIDPEAIPNSGNVPYTPRIKKVLALAGKEAKLLNHLQVGSEHLILGILREREGRAARVLLNHGADIDAMRKLLANIGLSP